MADAIDSTWLQARIDRTKAMIVAYEDAIDALSTGAQQYHLDTGQTRQIVQKAQLSQLKTTLAGLENRLATLNARLNGATSIARPGF